MKVQPRASRNQLLDLHSERLRVKLTAPPVEGEANRALIRFFAEKVGVPRSYIEIVSGKHSRQKTIKVRGAQVTDVAVRLGGSRR